MAVNFQTCGVTFKLCNELPDNVSVMHTIPKHFQELSKLRSDSILCDVTLIVGEKKLYAHETVLSYRIPFFRALFNSSMRESTAREVLLSSDLCEFDLPIIESLINYAYTGLLTISVGNVQSLMMGAVYLNLEYIIDECARFMRDRICVDNALSLLTFLQSIAYDKLERTIIAFIDANFVPISYTSEFLEWSFEDVRPLLKRDSLNIDDDKQVLEAVSRWIGHDVGREIYSEKLLKCVRRFNEKLRDKKFNQTHSAMIDPNFKKVLDNMKEKIWSKNKRRMCDDAHQLIVSFGKDNIQIYDPTKDTWTKSPIVVKSRNQARGYCEPIVVNQKIYMFDGFKSDDNSGYCFDTFNNAWHSIPGPAEKYQYFSATAFIDGTIYITGGDIGGERLSCMRKFDVAKREWSQGKSMNERRCAPAYCVYEGRFYVFGGFQNVDMQASCEYYNPHTDSWILTSPMAVPRCGAAAAVLGGKIYVVGGLDSSQTRSDMERYDPSTDTWEKLKSLQTARVCATLISSCGKIFAVGGFTYFDNGNGDEKDVPISTMEMYDPDTDCWEEMAALPDYAVNICALPIPATFSTPLVILETTFAPSHNSGFDCLVANGELLKAIHDKGFNHPSKIQHQLIPRAAHGLDVVCEAKSGTGKSTLSAIATLQQLEPMDGQVTALVLCKSRELATKMGETLKDLGKYLLAIKVAVFSGDCRIKKNRGILMNNCPHVVVGTPGRVLALVNSGALKINNIKQFVIDDCDEMVNDQEMHRDLRQLAKYLPSKKQVMIFSTENSSVLRTFCKSFVREAPNNTEAN